MLTFGKQKMAFFERCKYDTAFIMHSPHTHDYHELYFLEKGETTYFVGNSIYILNSGDFVFIESGEFHQTDNSRYPYLERVLLNFDDEFVGKDFIPLLQEFKANPHVRLLEDDVRKMRHLIKLIEQECMGEEENGVLLQQLYLRELLVLLGRKRKRDMVQDFGNAYNIAQNTATTISTDYKQPITLDTLAKKNSVSAGYLSKIFKKYTGMGVNEYLNIIRITSAKELLETTNISVTEVAYECGFNDSNYFSQVFKHLTGVTPKKYSQSFK